MINKVDISFLLVSVACFILTALGGWGGLQMIKINLGNHAVLTDAITVEPKLSSDGLYHALQTSKEYNSNQPGTHIKRIVTINNKDQTEFIRHLSNVAPGLGWYIHSARLKELVLVIPASEFHIISSIIKDPLNWIRREVAADRPARGPSNIDNLINVRIITNPDNTPSEWITGGALLTWSISLVFFIAGVAIAATAIISIITDKRRKGTV